MPEIPNAHSGAPLTIWLRQSTMGHWFGSHLDPPEPDAVEYVRKDVCERWMEAAAVQQRGDLLPAIQAALEALEDNDADGVMAILRTCLAIHRRSEPKRP